MKPQKLSAAEGEVRDPRPGQEVFPTTASHRAAVSAQAGMSTLLMMFRSLGSQPFPSGPKGVDSPASKPLNWGNDQ